MVPGGDVLVVLDGRVESERVVGWVVRLCRGRRASARLLVVQRPERGVSAIARQRGEMASTSRSQWSLAPNSPWRHRTGSPPPASIQRNSVTTLVSLTPSSCPRGPSCGLGVGGPRHRGPHSFLPYAGVVESA